MSGLLLVRELFKPFYGCLRCSMGNAGSGIIRRINLGGISSLRL